MLIGMKKRDFRGNKMLTKLEELIGKGHVLYDEPMKSIPHFVWEDRPVRWWSQDLQKM